MKKALICSLIAVAAASVHSAGFGIYEASARGNAMGGAVVGDTRDATANYHNPANIGFSTNIQLAAGVTFINPYCDIEVNHVSQDRMNPGWFTIPTFYATVPLPFDLALGWGNFTEYGLGSHYSPGWDLASDTQKTIMRQITLNPNLAWKATDWWSVSAGLRFSWIQFTSHKEPYHGQNLDVDANRMGTLTATDPFMLRSKLKGDDWGTGWNAATSVRPIDDVSIGLVYRSRIKHKIKGNFDLKGGVYGVASGTLNIPGVPYPVPTSTKISERKSIHLPANAKLRLPQSITLGVNWDVTKRYRVGTSLTWTEWSSINNVNFRIPGYGYTLPLRWRDTWRVGIGMEYDLYSWLSLRCGYSYDEDPSRKSHASTMLPAGDRHIIGLGAGFRITDNLRLDIGYNFIRMNNTHYNIYVKNYSGETEKYYVSNRNGYSHLASATLTYSF